MNRGSFLNTACAAGIGTALAGAASSVRGAEKKHKDIYELRRYTLKDAADRKRFDAFMAEVSIPAWNRIGIQPVAAFEEHEGDGLTMRILLTHKNFESVIQANNKLLADETFMKKGAEFLNAPKNDPAYERFVTQLMVAFDDIPHIEPYPGKMGLYELRQYESHNIIKAKRKVEMFNEGGEIALFREKGLRPVFFGESLAGEKMPNLTYMVAFKDMEDHDAGWKSFGDSEEWKTMRSLERYKDTVSNITRTFLKPVSYSQV